MHNEFIMIWKSFKKQKKKVKKKLSCFTIELIVGSIDVIMLVF